MKRVEVGDTLIFGDGHRCLVVLNELMKYDENYKLVDDSRIILVDLDTSTVCLHYREGIPYEFGEPYIPLWGGVVDIIRKRGK